MRPAVFALCVVVPSVLALSVSFQRGSYGQTLGAASGRRLFGSLHLDDEVTGVALVQLLRGARLARRDYAQTRFDGPQAAATVHRFLPHPQVHPLVMPFAVVATDPALHAALSPHLQDYRPRLLAAVPTSQSRRLLITSKQLRVILAHTPHAHLHLTSKGLLQMASRLDGPHRLAISEMCSAPRQQDGTKHAIALLFDSQLGPGVRDDGLYEWLGRTDSRSILWGCVADYVYGSPDWLPRYRQLLRLLAGEGDKGWRAALWEGKLLICALTARSIGRGRKALLVRDYLQRHAPAEIPLQVLAWLLSLLGKHRLWLDTELTVGIESSLRLMETLPGEWRPFWGDFDRLLDYWWAHVRTQHPIRSLDDLSAVVECNVRGDRIIKVSNLLAWWADEGTLLVDAGRIGVTIDMERDDGTMLACESFGDLLRVLTSVLEDELTHGREREGGRRGGHAVLPARRGRLSRERLWVAIGRTVASNLLYRHRITFTRIIPWLARVHEVGALQPTESLCDYVVFRLWQLGLGLFPGAVLRRGGAPKTGASVVSAVRALVARVDPRLWAGILMLIVMRTIRCLLALLPSWSV